MKIVDMTCINCPLGCRLHVEINDQGEITVAGNTCKLGENYAKQEAVSPKRIVTSIVRVDGIANAHTLSVKTKEPVPKSKIFEVMDELKTVKITSKTKIGDVVVNNIADTGVDIIATSNVG
ncbi:DUF1667 domain-containing protein [Criibacterium bergeronii]|uniref:DUF1667 domain-containing protein n=1 Tax=Criibacterium bergeronii TaxID=1871336 RepID=A0A552VB63_9FIRM|nr:DUF1667 domain-containing protein [Criibacterium bergeronii]TRW27721.1 DUF1667 domain-containing protein [Criibacterium bergeronii]